jgi:uncharacterized lipoprotein YmbA
MHQREALSIQIRRSQPATFRAADPLTSGHNSWSYELTVTNLAALSRPGPAYSTAYG